MFELFLLFVLATAWANSDKPKSKPKKAPALKHAVTESPHARARAAGCLFLCAMCAFVPALAAASASGNVGPVVVLFGAFLFLFVMVYGWNRKNPRLATIGKDPVARKSVANLLFIERGDEQGWCVIPKKDRWGDSVASRAVSDYGVPDRTLWAANRGVRCQLVFSSEDRTMATVFNHAIPLKARVTRQSLFEVRLNGEQRKKWTGEIPEPTCVRTIRWVGQSEKTWSGLSSFEFLLNQREEGEVIWKFDMARAAEMIAVCGTDPLLHLQAHEL